MKDLPRYRFKLLGCDTFDGIASELYAEGYELRWLHQSEVGLFPSAGLSAVFELRSAVADERLRTQSYAHALDVAEGFIEIPAKVRSRIEKALNL